MIGKIIKVEETKGLWWSVETQLYDNGQVGLGYRFEIRFTLEEMERIVKALGVDKPEQIVDADLYIQDCGQQLPIVSVLADLGIKEAMTEKFVVDDEIHEHLADDFIGNIETVGIFGDECQVDVYDCVDDRWVYGMCDIQNISRLERLVDGKDHSALVGHKVVYFAKTKKAYVAIQIK